MDTSEEALLNTAIRAAKNAGEFIKQEFKKEKAGPYSYKKDGSILTKTDLGAEKIILKIISAKFPQHAYFSEEKGSGGDDTNFLWVVDPLDGTTNFSRRVPYFGVSIGLLWRGRALLGVVYQPITDELFVAQRKRGAWLNGDRIRMDREVYLNKAVVAIERGGRTRSDRTRAGKIFDKMVKSVNTPRVPGAMAIDLCYTACGKFDAFVGAICHLHDYAAAGLVVEEAGALVTDLKGRRLDSKASGILAATPRLHRKILDILKAI